MVKKISILIIFFCVSILLEAQEQYTSQSKNAIKHLEKGVQHYNIMNFEKAIKQLQLAIKADKQFIEAYLLLAEVYIDKKEYENAIDTYKKGLPRNPDFFPTAFFNLANTELLIGRYEEAKGNFKSYLNFSHISEKSRKQAEQYLKRCNFGIKAKQNPVHFHPENLGPNINSEFDEYWPSLSADEKTLVITVLLPKDKNNPQVFMNRQEDFYISYKENGEWSKAKDIGLPLNTWKNEGAQSITADGQLMFFTACNWEDRKSMCDIYISKKIGDQWSLPINIGTPINTAASEKQPSISPDGKTLYFSSNRQGTIGYMDIWKSTLTEEGYWGQPENLGDSINTWGIEQSPFIHPDNQTLYFSSDGWLGMGKADMFITRKNSEGEWGTPVNLGYPINTYHEEIGFIVNAKGNKAYFSSDRLSETGKDIYTFDLYQEIRPVMVSYMKGKVFDADTKKQLYAKFELIDLESTEIIMEAYSNSRTGEFLICIPTGKDYALNVSKKGYLFFSENFALKDIYEHSEPYLMDVPLQPIKYGEKVILKNIFYEFDSYELKKKSIAELNKLLQFMNENPGLKIEISGHTDSDGTYEYNITLSQNRAKSIVNYLLENNINKDRISCKGYGESEPIATNETEKGKALNRRTEFKIISK